MILILIGTAVIGSIGCGMIATVNGRWIGHTFKDFENACPTLRVHAGLNVRFNEEKQFTSDDEIQRWAKQIVK